MSFADSAQQANTAQSFAGINFDIASLSITTPNNSQHEAENPVFREKWSSSGSLQSLALNAAIEGKESLAPGTGGG